MSQLLSGVLPAAVVVEEELMLVASEIEIIHEVLHSASPSSQVPVQHVL